MIEMLKGNMYFINRSDDEPAKIGHNGHIFGKLNFSITMKMENVVIKVVLPV